MPSLIELGELRICLYASSRCASRLLEQFRQFWSAYRFRTFHCSDDEIQYHHGEVWYLAIVSPHIPSERAYPDWLLESERQVCAKIHRKWATVFSLSRSSRMSTQPLWIKQRYLYIDHGNPNHSFCLVSDDADEQLAVHIFLDSIHLATWWHILRGSLCIHSAAVVKGDRGFLFLGDSKAGKTTVAQLSGSLGYPALGDDLNIVIRNEKESSYRLAAVPGAVPSPVGYSLLQPPLRGVFTLVQDDSDDYLALMSHRQTAHALFQGYMQTPSCRKLSDKMAGLVFRTCCDIARRVPGYELHFRKSPDFWKVIDERFSD